MTPSPAILAATGPRDLRDARRLAELEQTIQAGLERFIETGQALLEVRDSRLYRLNYATFEDYLKGRWNLSKSRGYQLMDAAEVSTVVDVSDERVARELAPVLRSEGPEAVRAVMAEVSANGHEPTAAAVRAVVGPSDDFELDGRRIRSDLAQVLQLLDRLAGLYPTTVVAENVDLRRRASTARRLRRLGTYLGGIAWSLEGEAP